MIAVSGCCPTVMSFETMSPKASNVDVTILLIGREADSAVVLSVIKRLFERLLDMVGVAKASMGPRAPNRFRAGTFKVLADFREDKRIFAVAFKAVPLSSLGVWVREDIEVTVLMTVLLSGFSVFATACKDVISVVRAAILASNCALVREQLSPLKPL